MGRRSAMQQFTRHGSGRRRSISGPCLGTYGHSIQATIIQDNGRQAKYHPHNPSRLAIPRTRIVCWPCLLMFQFQTPLGVSRMSASCREASCRNRASRFQGSNRRPVITVSTIPFRSPDATPARSKPSLEAQRRKRLRTPGRSWQGKRPAARGPQTGGRRHKKRLP